MKRVLKHKKSMAVAVILLAVLVIFFVNKTDDEAVETPALQQPQITPPVAGAPSQTPLPALREQQEKLAENLFKQPVSPGSAEFNPVFVKEALQRYADEHRIVLSESDLEELSKPVLELRKLIQQANDNIAKQQDPFNSEDQVRYMTELMSGETGFKKVMGITLSDFVETLSDEEVQKLFGVEEGAE